MFKPPALEVRELSVRYASRAVNALESISLELPRQGSLAVLGESGAGKSTLARAMLGLFAAGAVVTGSVRFGGVDMVTASATEMAGIRGKRIALLAQDPAWVFHPQRRVGAQIAECLALHGETNGGERARAALAEVELGEARFFDSYPHQLSGGQLQRAALALSLCCAPEVLIADEPTSALDTVTASRVLELLARLRAQRAISLILVLHDPRLAARTAEQVAVLHEGRIVESGAPSEVLRRPRHAFTRELVESASGAGWR